MRVAGTRWHVDDEPVQRTPIDLAQELGDGLVDHRPPPHHRRVLLDQEPQRHDPDAVFLERLNALLDHRRLHALESHHGRQRGAVDVGVEQAYAVSFGGHGEREVDGHRRFAYSALPAGHGEDVVDAHDRLLGGGLLRGAAGDAGLLLQGDRDALDALEVLEQSAELLEDVLRQRLGGVDQDLERDLAATHGQLLDAAQGDQILVAVGILDAPDGPDDVFFLQGRQRESWLR